jgi:amino acid transporter
MTALFPVKGPIFELPKRFLDQSVGYATGWITWYSSPLGPTMRLIVLRFGWIVLIAAELLAITHLFQFNYPPELLSAAGYPSDTLSFSPDIAPGVVILIFLPVVLVCNLLPVKYFGQIEYVCGSIKIAIVVFLILLNTILHSMQRVRGETLFWTYNAPYGATSQNITLADGETVVSGGAGQLAGTW